MKTSTDTVTKASETPEVLTLREALLGGPGLDGYAFNADVYCVEHGKEIIRQIFDKNPQGIDEILAQDSDTIPQPIFFGESDCRQYCAECGEYLYGEDNDDNAEIE